MYFIVTRYIFSGFGMLYQEKSGNPGMDGSGLDRADKPWTKFSELKFETGALEKN
jgi:hypothetical protein